MADLVTLENIGSVTAKRLQKIGIRTAEDFLSRDPCDVFDELREKVDPTLCCCALAGLVGAKRGVKWHEIIKQSTKEYEKLHPGHGWGEC